MKKTFYFLGVLFVLITISLPQTVKAQETASIEVAQAAICRAVVDREPVGVGDTFGAWTGKLYCFTRIVGAYSPVEITHVWYFGDAERARISLLVRSASWRTWTSKRIQTHEIGFWHVDVVGPDGRVLRSVEFEITP